jgi:hypothetical protein
VRRVLLRRMSGDIGEHLYDASFVHGTVRAAASGFEWCGLVRTHTSSYAASCVHPFDEMYTQLCANATQIDHTNGYSLRYYYDAESNECRQFWFGNCQTKSLNIWPDLTTCQWVCERSDERKRQPLSTLLPSPRARISGGAHFRKCILPRAAHSNLAA